MNRAGFNELFARAKRSAQFAVSHGQSPILSLVSNHSSDTSLSVSALFLTAFAATNDGDYEGWVSARGLMAMADLVFHHHSDFRSLPAQHQEDLYYGSMTAIWMIPTANRQLTPERIIEARAKLCKKIRGMNPPTNLIRSALSTWISLWRRNDSISRHITLLHWFPLRLSSGATEQLIERVNSLCTGAENEGHYDLTEAEALGLRELADGDTLASSWRSLSDNEIAAFFVVFSFNIAKYEVDIIKSVFCMVATTTKSTFSDQWLQSRWANIQQDNPALLETDAIDREVLALYETFFQRPLITVNSKVNILYYSYFLAHQQRLDGVKRIIEQAKAPHVSGLNALCNLTLRFPTVTYTVLKQLFGVRQVTNVVKLAASLIYNPYVTLITNTVPVAMYADIAFLATEILYSASGNRRNRQARYVSPAEKSLTKTVEYLRALATNLIAEQERQATQDMASHAILGAYGLAIPETRGTQMVIGELGGERAANEGEAPDNEQQLMVVDIADFEAFITRRRNEQDVSFVALMTELSRVTTQATLPLPTGDDAAASASAMSTTALPEDLLTHIAKLDVNPDRAWSLSAPLLELNTLGSYKVSVGLLLSNSHRTENVNALPPAAIAAAEAGPANQRPPPPRGPPPPM